MTFYNEVEKPVNVFKTLGVRKYFKVYVLALKNRYRHRGIAKEMLLAAYKLAASAFVPAICGIFTTGHTQKIAEDIGFKKLNEIYYIRYLIDELIVFWDTGLGNYGAALMAYRIPDVDEPVDLHPQHSSRFAMQTVEVEEEESGRESPD
ncbi:Uncharacterized protein OBRU01_04361 [Operophtera brumata]|uniref:N-acetyltransferase domain-containing protein n=1 Tax=Operophtera brumata TaxID=104452 RepID=A0A0L7LLM0_OPEBR|nr:Uncharacterized protein OBRU01_04361 [Operophtera brumata]